MVDYHAYLLIAFVLSSWWSCDLSVKYAFLKNKFCHDEGCAGHSVSLNIWSFCFLYLMYYICVSWCYHACSVKTEDVTHGNIFVVLSYQRSQWRVVIHQFRLLLFTVKCADWFVLTRKCYLWCSIHFYRFLLLEGLYDLAAYPFTGVLHCTCGYEGFFLSNKLCSRNVLDVKYILQFSSTHKRCLLTLLLFKIFDILRRTIWHQGCNWLLFPSEMSQCMTLLILCRNQRLWWVIGVILFHL